MLLVANWKMLPDNADEACKVSERVNSAIEKVTQRNFDTVLCPPFVWMVDVGAAINAKRVSLGAQDIFWEPRGAFTGEIGAKMLRSLGVRYVIVGHSERRLHLNEPHWMIQKKMRSATEAGLYAILAVGESGRSRNAQKLVTRQILTDLDGFPKRLADKLIIAYEPVWAIGSGRPATPEYALVMAITLRRVLINRFGPRAKNTPVIYGGSTNASNLTDFLKIGRFQGALIGGASLERHGEEFVDMIHAAAKVF